jgi:hypothetical protein
MRALLLPNGNLLVPTDPGQGLDIEAARGRIF